MTGRRALGFVLLVLAFAAASWVGWWMVPVTALLWGALRPVRRRPAATAALAAALAAASWLALNALADGRAFVLLSDRIAGVMAVPKAALLAVTIALPALLAWSGSGTGSLLRAHRANHPHPNA